MVMVDVLNTWKTLSKLKIFIWQLGILVLLGGCDVLNEAKIVLVKAGLLPSFLVESVGVSSEEASLLANELSIEENIRQSNGKLFYLDEELFQKLPMNSLGEGEPEEDGIAIRKEAFNFEAIGNLPTYSEQEALDRVKAALEKAGLLPNNEPQVLHSTFEAVDKNGQEVTNIALDTQVVYSLTTPDGTPISGPGADIKVVFNGEGVVTQLIYADRKLKQGRDIEVLSLDEADRLAIATLLDMSLQQVPQLQNRCLNTLQEGNLCLESKVAYYAPPMDLTGVTEILPHYIYRAILTIGGEEVFARKLYIPAAAIALQLDLNATIQNDTVQAEVLVSGGQEPYTYNWSSVSTNLDNINITNSNISYTLAPRLPTNEEVISVLVTDANGIRGSKSFTLAISSSAIVNSYLPLANQNIAIGSEWIGDSQGLPESAANVRGLIQGFEQADVNVAFNHGELQAFAKDFIDPSLGGQDNQYIDNVDLAFYTGHASGSGFAFSTEQDAAFLFFDEVLWGNDGDDLEWMFIAACGPLQERSGGKLWWERWGGAFGGLHLMLAYANETFDNSSEGRLFTTYSLTNNLSLRQAWVQTATDVQGASEIYAIMGVWGEDGLNNYNDHFWEHGEVGPDIPEQTIEGFWRLSGPS